MPRLPIPLSDLKAKLVQENLLSPERFDALADEAERKHQDLIDLLISERIADAGYLYAFLASLLGVELAHLAVRPVDESSVKLLPEDVAREYQVVVFDREPDGTLDVAMADPSNLETIEFLTQRLGTRIKPFLATADDLNRSYAIFGLKRSEDFKKIIEKNVQASLSGQGKSTEEAAAELPIVSIVESVISYAVSSRASDIHIEALEETTLIRYRIDGILKEVMRIPKEVHTAIAARIKLLAGLKIDEHFRPQDGRFRHSIVNQIIDIRVSVMPTYYGEKLVMRLLESSQKPLSLEELGMLPSVAKVVAANLCRTYGMILATGPTGSGKTTSLYAFMNIVNKPGVNIVSIEDPIEYNMRYVNQSQVNPQAGITFASGLRSLLRQDPNIIMVGEIRDAETAQIAVQAALTGHLILSTLHTSDAPTAVPRLFNLGVPPFLLVSVLNIVIAQRLVRRICQTCISSYEAGDDVRQAIREELAKVGASEKETLLPRVLYRGRGCSSCGESGYRGRLGIYEVLDVTEAVRAVILDPQFTLETLRRVAREGGMRTMFEDGITKAELGQTTIEEVLRVIRE